MQLELPFLRSDPSPGVVYVRERRARRYILRVRPDGSVRVTIPRGGSRREAETFLATQAAWVARERQRVRASHAPVEWGPGTTILFRGVPVRLEAGFSAGRAVIRYGSREVPVDRPGGDLRPAVERDLRQVAREELAVRLHALAAANGLAVRRVIVRDQRSRWGSCSPGGTIALNFRLVQMPDHVRDYVLVHELMHLRQQNHSRRYWRLVEAACPGFREAERWLGREGRRLF